MPVQTTTQAATAPTRGTLDADQAAALNVASVDIVVTGSRKRLRSAQAPAQATTTFGGRSNFGLPILDKTGREWSVSRGDSWAPKNAIDGRPVWLPIEREGDRPIPRWRDRWSLEIL